VGLVMPRSSHQRVKRRRCFSRKVLRRLEQIENLPRRDQDALLRTIDAFLAKSA